MTKLSNRLSILYSEYPGDDAWNEYISCFPDIDAKLAEQMPIEAEFAKALYWNKGEDLARVKSWLKKPVPALDGKTFYEVLKLKEGRTILRTAIMRMP